MIGFGTLQSALKGNLSELLQVSLEWCIKYNRRIIIDTAQEYGQSETIIGNFMNKHVEANKYFSIITKGGISFNKDNPYHSLSDLNVDIRTSINKLNVPQVHCYMMHRLNPKMNKRDLIQQLSYNREYFETIGFSEITLSDLKELYTLSNTCGLKLEYVEYAASPFIRRIERLGIADFCREHNIKILSYTSTLRGLLNRKILEMESYKDLPTEIFKQVLFEKLNIHSFEQTVGIYDNDNIKDNCNMVINFIKLSMLYKIDPSTLSLLYNRFKGYISIPGTTDTIHMLNNLNSIFVPISSDIIKHIDNMCENFRGNPNPSILNYLDTVYDK